MILEYHRPESLDEAMTLLSRKNPSHGALRRWHRAQSTSYDRVRCGGLAGIRAE